MLRFLILIISFVCVIANPFQEKIEAYKLIRKKIIEKDSLEEMEKAEMEKALELLKQIINSFDTSLISDTFSILEEKTFLENYMDIIKYFISKDEEKARDFAIYIYETYIGNKRVHNLLGLSLSLYPAYPLNHYCIVIPPFYKQDLKKLAISNIDSFIKCLNSLNLKKQAETLVEGFWWKKELRKLLEDIKNYLNDKDLQYSQMWEYYSYCQDYQNRFERYKMYSESHRIYCEKYEKQTDENKNNNKKVYERYCEDYKEYCENYKEYCKDYGTVEGAPLSEIQWRFNPSSLKCVAISMLVFVLGLRDLIQLGEIELAKQLLSDFMDQYLIFYNKVQEINRKSATTLDALLILFDVNDFLKMPLVLFSLEKQIKRFEKFNGPINRSLYNEEILQLPLGTLKLNLEEAVKNDDGISLFKEPSNTNPVVMNFDDLINKIKEIYHRKNKKEEIRDILKTLDNCDFNDYRLIDFINLRFMLNYCGLNEEEEKVTLLFKEIIKKSPYKSKTINNLGFGLEYILMQFKKGYIAIFFHSRFRNHFDDEVNFTNFGISAEINLSKSFMLKIFYCRVNVCHKCRYFDPIFDNKELCLGYKFNSDKVVYVGVRKNSFFIEKCEFVIRLSKTFENRFIITCSKGFSYQ